MHPINTFSQEITLLDARAIPSGYGFKRIFVTLSHNGKTREFSHSTNNMRAYDAATELDGSELHAALYWIIEGAIEEQVQQWINEVDITELAKFYGVSLKESSKENETERVEYLINVQEDHGRKHDLQTILNYLKK